MISSILFEVKTQTARLSLIFPRAFNVGDRVSINNTVGVMVEPCRSGVLAAIMFRMNGISRYESMDGLGRAKQEARAESTWQGLFPTTPCISSILGGQMCGAIGSVLHMGQKIATSTSLLRGF